MKNNIVDIYPLAPMQEGILFHHLYDDDKTLYNVQIRMRLAGNIDIPKMESSFRIVVDRYDILRTSFIYKNLNTPRQVVLDKRGGGFNCLDFHSLSTAERKKQINDFLKRDAEKIFDLTHDLLFRITLIHEDEKSYILVITHHHIILDGWSLARLLYDLFSIYQNLLAGITPPPSAAFPYIHYINWYTRQDRDRAREYWKNYLSGFSDATVIPGNSDHGSIKSYIYKETGLKLPEETTSRLEEFAAANSVTLNTLLQAVFGSILLKYNKSNDILFGCVISGRPSEVQGVESIPGLFINTIPLRIRLKGGETFLELIREIHSDFTRSSRYGYLPLYDIRKTVSSPNAIINHLFGFQNYPVDESLLSSDFFAKTGFAITDFESVDKTTYNFNFKVGTGKSLLILFGYNSCVIEDYFIKNMVCHVKKVITVLLENPQTGIGELDILPADERNTLLKSFNNTFTPHELSKPVHVLFEEQADQYPGNTAVVYKDRHLSYHQLNRKADGLARTLMTSGIKKEEIAAIMTGHSLEMITGLIGILKAGAAFLPIDPSLPIKRIKFMLEECRCKILLSSSDYRDTIPFDGLVLDLDDEKNYQNSETPVKSNAGPDSLAYVIFTSGSSGAPKGVMVEHRSLCNLSLWHGRYYGMTPADRTTKYAGFSFDASVWEVFPSLISGASLYIIDEAMKLDIKKLNNYFEENGITISFLPTQIAEQFMNEDNRSLRYLLTGGDKLKFFRKNHYRLVNNYGPTENTVVTTCYPVTGEQKNIPIGKPVDNTRIYILDEQNRLMPIGIPGELCISGASLARGYINRQELTDKKFVSNPFEPGVKMYKTGDLARWLPDGNIEFLGRIDCQVKIRSNRIEPGEIEALLMKHNKVREAVVLDKSDRYGNKYLCGYIVLKNNNENTHLDEEIKRYLAELLPDYMIPSHYVYLDHIPVSASGKVNRKELPDPVEFSPKAEYVPPGDDMERRLAEIWQEVLGTGRPGITDNFYEAGGDSIKAIQISSRLYKYGLTLEVKDLLTYSTIKEIRPFIRKTAISAGQEQVQGKVEFLPVHRWFIEHVRENREQFNNSVLIYKKDGFNEEYAAKVIKKLYRHHDALRLVLAEDEESLINNAYENTELLTVYHIEDEEGSEYIRKTASTLNKGFHLKKGPLFTAALFKTRTGDHLLFILHHFIVDGVSWRLILEDFKEGYMQYAEKGRIEFPPKSHSFKRWSDELQKYSTGNKLQKEYSYWKKICETAGQRKHGQEKTSGIIRNTIETTIVLGSEETGVLVKKAHIPYNTDINDLLLAALSKAFYKWHGMRELLINLESHGRDEQLVDGISITRTVGWFTAQYPVLLTMDDDTGAHIISVKENLRTIPHKGIGYGLLRYSGNAEQKAVLDIEPGVSFNYLGDLDSVLDDGLFRISPVTLDPVPGGVNEYMYSINFNGMIRGGCLSFTITCDAEKYNSEEVNTLGRFYYESLNGIIEFCKTATRRVITASDVDLLAVGLPHEDISGCLDTHGATISYIMNLAPMQEGMLFHHLYDRNDAYIFQMGLRITGEMDSDSLKESIRFIVKRHDALRTGIIYDRIKNPLQFILKERDPFFLHTEAVNEHDLETYIRRDWDNGFDLYKDSLIRFHLFQLKKDDFYLLITNHHIIMDGWCIGILVKELFTCYKVLKAGGSITLPPSVSYSEFLKWINKKDKETAYTYWQKYLDGYIAGKGITPAGFRQKSPEYRNAEHRVNMDRALTVKLNEMIKQHGFTLNNFMQAVWGIVLSRYTNSEEVLFGNIISTRPTDIEGIETTIGLFINTIPIRIKMESGVSFIELARKVKDDFIECKQYGYISLAEIMHRAHLDVTNIDHLFVVENYPVDKDLLNGAFYREMGCTLYRTESRDMSSYNLNIMIIPGDQVTIRLTYNENICESSRIRQMGKHIINLVEAILENPAKRVGELELLSGEEIHMLLHDFNKTEFAYPRGKLIHELFQEQAEKFPAKNVLSCNGMNVTYEEVNERSNRLAWALRERGAGPGTITALMIDRSLDLITGILGILKAGSAFLPVDPSYPQNRIAYMLADSKALILLSKKEYVKGLDYSGVFLELDDPCLYKGNPGNPDVEIKSRDLAYMIYTSGSTGKPKGVLIEHSGVINMLFNYHKLFEADEFSRISQSSSISFDAMVFEIIPALTGGCLLMIIPDEIRVHPAELKKWIMKNEITISFQPTAIAEALLDMEWEQDIPLKKLITAGDRLTKYPPDHCPFEVYNLYGPTEDTVWTTWCKVEKKDDNKGYPSIGGPVGNKKLYIVDRNNRLQPPGVAGELCISGSGLARGYFNRPELTDEKFIDNPFARGERMYKTGDVCRWQPDGTLEFIGRIDDQVKIRGYRIEPGEVENAISQLKGIKECVVVAREKGGELYLCCYIVEDHAIAIEDIREKLMDNVPHYMIPAYFVKLTSLPLTENGKIDKKRLPEPEALINRGTFTSPRHDVDRALQNIWKEILEMEKVSINDNFFEIGGHSLKATRVISYIKKILKADVSVREFLERPTIEELSDYLLSSKENRNIGKIATIYLKVLNLSDREVDRLMKEKG
ncbi:MAG: amino acid adenylation domain-containing protein [Spirochaetales bacterium]|nr:amino acid adenylation domain-containing protein [Spirochaetales bacterium]